MPEKISIVKESGETVSSNIVSVFTIPDTEKKYIITTENSVDPHGLTVLHVSEIVDGSLKKIATDEEWSSIKTIMRAIISGNVGSYKYLPTIEVIKADGQYSRDISVSSSASKQMIDNYNAADTSQGEGEADGSIFPDSKVETDEENEVMPGIAEVAEDAAPESIDETPAAEAKTTDAPETIEAEAPQQEAQDAPAVEETPAVETTEAPAASETVAEAAPAAPAPEATPEVEVQQPAAPETPAVEVAPETPAAEVAPTPVEAAPAPVLSNEIQVVDTPEAVSTVEVVAPQPAEPVVPAPPVVTTTVESTPVTTVAPEVQVVPEAVQTVVQPVAVTPEVVQVVQPTQVVPTAQIVQGVPEAPLTPPVQFNTNVDGSFQPEATLDEVVKGAQDMFMEGVRNLVQTIQEKVYRDLYKKEAEMKQREALVAQKEQMLNSQFATMMSNITANFNGVSVLPTDPNNTTNPQG